MPFLRQMNGFAPSRGEKMERTLETVKTDGSSLVALVTG